MSDNPYSGTRANDYTEERLAYGGFRCDRCAMVWPLPINYQDGYHLCERCFDSMGRIEAQQIIGEAQGGVQITPLPIPPIAPFLGAWAVTKVAPLSVTLQHGGASQTVNLSGVNLSAADVITYTEASITATSVVLPTLIVLTISAAGGAVPGDYDILYNGNTLTPRGILKVR